MPLQGAPEGVTMAPPLSGSKTVTGLPDMVLNVILKGLSGPVNEKKYDAQMVPMESNDDEWIAAVASYIRNNFDNNASFITTNEVARVRAAFKQRSLPWTHDELKDVVPQYLSPRTNWVLTASHNKDVLTNAIDGKMDTRYDTGVPQATNMWVQIELPAATNIAGVYLDAGTSPKDFPKKYKVEVSADGKDWGKKPVASGSGNARTTEIMFKPVKTKFIRITQTGESKDRWWSIHEMQLLQPADPEKIKAALAKKAEASKLE
jgi:hypothetical protein